MSAIDNTRQNINTQSEAQTWRPLHHFNYYRLTLALALLAFFHGSVLGGFLGQYKPEAFLATALVFLGSSLVFIFIGFKKFPAFESQVILGNSSDILLITLMMHYSGGLVSALGMLIVINIAATGTFLRSRDSYLFAAIASIAVISEQTYSFLNQITPAVTYSFAGILGLVFFGSSMLASILSRRARESEALVSQRTADLISLEKLNEHIIQNMRTGILVVDKDGHIRMANSSAEILLGNVSLKDNPLLENIFPALDARFLEWQEQPQIHQQAIRQQQGLPDVQPGFRSLDENSPYAGDTLVFLEDATQLNQRFQQMKLASLGRLTASIAHEIRNPLSAINHASQLLNESHLDEADRKLTQIITTQVQRLDQIVKNVLQLSRQEKSSQETIHLLDWLMNFKQEFCSSHDLAEKQMPVDIKPDDILVLFDSSHLYQVISNLVGNALSHSDKPQHEIKISISGGYDQDQPYIDIIDNGPGIDQELAQQIFDPFFTTSTKGTGLGLYISKEILESNRAKIRYIEPADGGSCFSIQFLSSASKGVNLNTVTTTQ